MTNSNDDKLIASFLEKNKGEIADNGFSHRVCEPLRLQRRLSLVSMILNIALVIIFVGLFFWGGGIDLAQGLITDGIKGISSEVTFLQGIGLGDSAGGIGTKILTIELAIAAVLLAGRLISSESDSLI